VGAMQSLELRWFVAGALPDGALEAFAEASGGGFAGASGVFAGVSADVTSPFEERIDRYLLGTGEERGIKQRGHDGPYEDKRREGVDGGILEVEGLSPIPADVERWNKAIFSASALPHDSRWITVHKRRALRWLAQGRAELTALSFNADELAANGLRAPEGLVFHSLAFECSARRGRDGGERLRGAAVRLLDGGDPVWRAIADDGHCLGYPAWLEWAIVEAEG